MHIQASWDSYIDNLIAQSKDSSGHTNADQAVIIGIDGGAKWTTDVSMKGCLSVRQYSTSTEFMNIYVTPITDYGSYKSLESANVHVLFVSESPKFPEDQ